MATSLPLPIRIAAGLVASGLDHLRRLPAELPALSVTLAGQAVRASMRVQQELAELANRGDELLSPIIDRPEEHPTWARFDDEPVPDESDRAVFDPDPAVDADPATDAAGVENYVTDEPLERDRGDRDSDPAANGDDVVAVAGPRDEQPGPAALPGYAGLRAAQVRARLRGLSEEQVADVLEFERSHGGRAAYLTLLENRLATVRAGDPTAGSAARGAPA